MSVGGKDVLGPRPIVFFDGDCGLCSRSVRFLLDRDPDGALRFAHLQGDLAASTLPAAARSVERDGSVVLLEPAGGSRWSVRSEAIARALGYLPPPWSWLGAIAGLRALRPCVELAYRFVARHRIRWFGRADACALPDPRLRARFLGSLAGSESDRLGAAESPSQAR